MKMFRCSIRNIVQNVLGSSYKNLTLNPSSAANISVHNLTPIYSFLKLLRSKYFRCRIGSFLPNCFKRPLVPLVLDTTSHFNSYNRFNPGAFFILSLSFPFFGAKSEEDKKEDEIVTTMKLAILASRRGEDAKAEQLLHLALKSAQEMNDWNAITYIYDLMANFALEKGNFKKAETLFVDVLKRFLQNGMADDDNAVVEVSLKLASIYSHLGDMEKACEGFQFCIGTQESKLKTRGEDDIDEDTFVLWAMSHDWFARFLLKVGHYDRAKEHFSRAYDVCVKVKGAEDPQVAVLLNDLGSVCSLQQKYDEAIEFLNRAIHIGKLSESEDLASFYVNLGTIYMQKKAYDDAEVYCKEGRKLAKAVKNDEAFEESSLCLDTLKELKQNSLSKRKVA